LSLALLILIPFLAAAVCWRIRNRVWLERVNVASAIGTLVVAMFDALAVRARGVIESPGGLLRADALSAVVVVITAFVTFVCAVYAVGYLREEQRLGLATDRLLHRYYTLTPVFVGTMMAVPLMNNLGLLWVAIESTTLASVLLVRFYNQKSSLEAAWKYIIIGSAGMALALFGTVLTYFSAVPVLGEHAGHAFEWSVLVAVAGRCQPEAMRLAFVFVLVGYGTKAGLAPMHTWKPDAYAEAPVPSAGLLGAGFINCAVYGIIRFYVLAAKCLGHAYAGHLLVVFGIASILVAAPFVLTQRNFRRLLAYSSIDHAGIMVAAVGFGGKLGALGAMLHMVFHGVTKPLMFFCAGNVQQQFGTAQIRKVTGVMRVLPWTGVLFFAATFAVIGVPPFGIFQIELTILAAALAADRGWAAALFVAGLVAIFAGFLVRMSKLTLGAPQQTAGRERECRWKVAAMILVALPLAALGFVIPAPLYDLVRGAAAIVGVAS